MSTHDRDPVEEYLDRLLVSLPGSPREVRHLLAEVECHLDDLVEAGRREGLDEYAARVRAVERMGPVDQVLPRVGVLPPITPARRRRLALAVLLVGGVGGIAVGLAGAVAAVVRAIWGDRSIAVVFPAGSYTSADCDRWLRLYPHRSCLQAMTADHASDFLLAATACGIAGTLVLLGRALLARRWRSPSVVTAFPAGSEEVVGALLAAVAAIGFAAQGVDGVLVTHGRGAGQPFSLAAGAGLAALLLGGLARSVRERPLLARRG